MNKPIEAGCRAVIINSMAGNDGIMVTVLYKVAENSKHVNNLGRYGDNWAIDRVINTNFGMKVKQIGEKQLQRIDDEEKDEELPANTVISWEDMKDIWTPEEVVC